MPDLFDIIVSFLNDTRKAPKTKVASREKHDFWSDGYQILSKDEATIETLAILFERLGGEACTGYYDPGEDARQGETDDHTGYYIWRCTEGTREFHGWRSAARSMVH